MLFENETPNLLEYLSALKPLALIFLGISFTTIHNGLSVISIIVGVGYALRKWYLMEKNEKNKK